MSAPWTGNRAQRANGESDGHCSGCSAILRFAGKTAISNAMRPQAAHPATGGQKSAKPSPISATPLTRTAARCHGIHSGIIRKKKPDFTKCIMPATTNRAPSNTRLTVNTVMAEQWTIERGLTSAAEGNRCPPRPSDKSPMGYMLLT